MLNLNKNKIIYLFLLLIIIVFSIYKENTNSKENEIRVKTINEKINVLTKKELDIINKNYDLSVYCYYNNSYKLTDECKETLISEIKYSIENKNKMIVVISTNYNNNTKDYNIKLTQKILNLSINNKDKNIYLFIKTYVDLYNKEKTVKLYIELWKIFY